MRDRQCYMDPGRGATIRMEGVYAPDSPRTVNSHGSGNPITIAEFHCPPSRDGMTPLSVIGEDDVMQFPKVRMHMVLALLVFSWGVWAQVKTDRDVEIHKNAKLIVTAPAPDIPEDIAKQYQTFLPIFEEVLKASLPDQSDECALTLRVSIGVKEIGAAKVKRPMARISAFRRNSRQEYVGSFILYSYMTSGMVSKEETEQFLKKQILDPAECKKAD